MEKYAARRRFYGCPAFHSVMERYMLRLENNGHSRTGAGQILRSARALVWGAVVVRDVRVAAAHIELDITIPDGSLNDVVRAFGPVGNLIYARLIVEEYVPKERAIQDGIRYFNAERFWECHEAFEGVWKGCCGDEKDLVQGIILAAAGLVHYQKNEDPICISIFGRALKKLANGTGTYHTIDVDVLRRRLQDMVGSGRISTFTLA